MLETEFETAEGAVRIIDFMPIRDKSVDLVRIVEGSAAASRCTWS